MNTNSEKLSSYRLSSVAVIFPLVIITLLLQMYHVTYVTHHDMCNIRHYMCNVIHMLQVDEENSATKA